MICMKIDITIMIIKTADFKMHIFWTSITKLNDQYEIAKKALINNTYSSIS